MTAIVVIIIALIIIIAIFNWLKDFVRDHWYITISVVAVIVCLIFADGITALWVAGGFVVVRLIWIGILKIREFNRKRRELIQKKHKEQFLNWMNANCLMLGKTSVDMIIDGNAKIKIPGVFLRYTYPEGTNCRDLVSNFLNSRQAELESIITNAIYDELHSAGMMDDADIQAKIISEYDRATRTRGLSVMCSKSIDNLLSRKLLDRPVKGENTLHCVGVIGGTSFRSKEITVEIEI